MHLIGRGGRQRGLNPAGGQGQEQPPAVDYRRLVFISSDSSSGREEDDADSSCSSSSYLNGLPRSNGGHAQSLEDCDWDYFESGSLPLPAIALGAGVNVGADHVGVAQDWSCCPGRGSAACQVMIRPSANSRIREIRSRSARSALQPREKFESSLFPFSFFFFFF